MRSIVRIAVVVGCGAVGAGVAQGADSPGMGFIVKALGDVDGDGTPDFGAARAPVRGAPVQAGKVIVFSGKDGERLWLAEGFDVTTLPDEDGDDQPEVVIALERNRMQTPFLSVRSGSGRVLRNVEVALPEDLAGDEFEALEVHAAGDVDGDGTADLLFVLADKPLRGSDAWCTDVGAVVVSAQGALLAQLDVEAYATRRSFVALPAGDVDGDGRGDFFVRTGFIKRGRLPLRIVSAQGEEILGFKTSSYDMPLKIGMPGDLNGDGKSDFLFSDPLASNGSRKYAGIVRLISGKDGKKFRVVKGESEGAGLGAAMVGIGDIDGDGTPDIAAGAIGAEPKLRGKKRAFRYGGVFAFSGKSGKRLWRAFGEESFEHLGSSLAAIGDVDGDGVTDLVAGAPGKVRQGGRVVALSGKTGKVLFSAR